MVTYLLSSALGGGDSGDGTRVNDRMDKVADQF